MTNNLPIAQPSIQEWQMMKEQASMLIRSRFLPSSVTIPEQAIAIMLKGRELGMPMMQSFQQLNIIQGKPCLSAEGMLALVFRHYPATKLDYQKNDDESCIIEVTKPGNSPQTFSFTIQDAEKAQLTGKDNWKKYRRAMLRSRCISEMCRAIFPDALQGCSYTKDEMEDAIDVEHTRVAKPQSQTAIAPPPAPQTLDEKRSEMLNYFSKNWPGIKLNDLIKKDPTTCDESDLVKLRAAAVSLRQGMEWASIVDMEQGVGGVAVDAEYTVDVEPGTEEPKSS